MTCEASLMIPQDDQEIPALLQSNDKLPQTPSEERASPTSWNQLSGHLSNMDLNHSPRWIRASGDSPWFPSAKTAKLPIYSLETLAIKLDKTLLIWWHANVVGNHITLPWLSIPCDLQAGCASRPVFRHYNLMFVVPYVCWTTPKNKEQFDHVWPLEAPS